MHDHDHGIPPSHEHVPSPLHVHGFFPDPITYHECAPPSRPLEALSQSVVHWRIAWKEFSYAFERSNGREDGVVARPACAKEAADQVRGDTRRDRRARQTGREGRRKKTPL